MNYNRIIQLNRKQFDATIRREGQLVLNYWKDVEEKIIFSKSNSSKTSQDRLNIFFDAKGSIKKGDILKFKDNYYLVINENYYENDVWRNSNLIKCNTLWNIYGEFVPLVSSELSSASPQFQKFGETVGGKVNLMCKDTQVVHDRFDYNASYNDFGGTYGLVNKFFIDGIAYLYFERGRTGDAQEMQMYYMGNAQYSLSNEKEKLKFFVAWFDSGSNYNFAPTAKITYSVDNEDIATVDEYGVLTFKTKGTVNVTARGVGTLDQDSGLSKEFDVSKTVAITVLGEGNNFLEITNADSIPKGKTRIVYVHEFDANLDEVPITEPLTLTYEFIDTNGEKLGDYVASNYVTVSYKETNYNEPTFALSNDPLFFDIQGNFLRITFTTERGTTKSADLEIKIR